MFIEPVVAPLTPSDLPEFVTAPKRTSHPGIGMAAMSGVGEQHREQNHNSLPSNSFQLSRYAPGSSEPWTQYSSTYGQSHEPSPAENLFAPGHSPTRDARYTSQYYSGVGNFQGGNVFVTHQNKDPHSVMPGSSLDDDDDDDNDDYNDDDDDDDDDENAIGQPPSSNPVGPPLGGFGSPAQMSAADIPKVKKKGGRTGKLDPGVKARAKSKRSAKDTCWHCRMLRIPVWHNPFLKIERKLTSSG